MLKNHFKIAWMQKTTVNKGFHSWNILDPSERAVWIIRINN